MTPPSRDGHRHGHPESAAHHFDPELVGPDVRGYGPPAASRAVRRGPRPVAIPWGTLHQGFLRFGLAALGWARWGGGGDGATASWAVGRSWALPGPVQGSM